VSFERVFPRRIPSVHDPGKTLAGGVSARSTATREIESDQKNTC